MGKRTLLPTLETVVSQATPEMRDIFAGMRYGMAVRILSEEARSRVLIELSPYIEGSPEDFQREITATIKSEVQVEN